MRANNPRSGPQFGDFQCPPRTRYDCYCRVVGANMRRRDFLGLAGGGAISWPRAAWTQSSARMRRLGILVPFSPGDSEGKSRLDAFMQGIAAAGWNIGRDLLVETRYGGGNADLTKKHAHELVALSPDAILVQASPQVALLKPLTQTIPIIFVNVTDPVEAGFVQSLARPGGNITGFSNFEDAIAGKWLELVLTLAPATKRVLFLMNERNPSNPRFLQFIQQSAPQWGIAVTKGSIQNADEIRQAITTFGSQPNGAMIVPPDNSLTLNRQLIVNLAAEHQLPAVYVFRAYVTAGGLMSYGIDVADIFRKAAGYVDRVLKGAPVRDLPVQAPTKFEFVFNMKVARSLGLNPSPSFVALADEVTE